MKTLLRAMDRLRPAFHSGPLRLFRPAYDAIDNFLYSYPGRTTVAPHIRDPINVKRYMSAVLLAVTPSIVAAVCLFGWRVLATIVVTYVAGLSIELAFAIARREEINEGFFVTGLLYPLTLPPGLPMWMVAAGIAFGVVVGKELFGGTGRNPFNPALVGRCFLLIGYPLAMSNTFVPPAEGVAGGLARYTADAVTTATPLAAAKQGAYADLAAMALGNRLGCAGETSAVAVAAGAVLLLLTGVANWRTVVSAIGSFAALSVVLIASAPGRFGLLGGSRLPVGQWTFPLGGDPWTMRLCSAAWLTAWHLLAGGLLFGVVFMATDPVTSPISRGGKWVYGAIVGVCTLLIRHLTGYVEGVMFAILLGNVAAPILDEAAAAIHLRRLRDEG